MLKSLRFLLIPAVGLCFVPASNAQPLLTLAPHVQLTDSLVVAHGISALQIVADTVGDLRLTANELVQEIHYDSLGRDTVNKGHYAYSSPGLSNAYFHCTTSYDGASHSIYWYNWHKHCSSCPISYAWEYREVHTQKRAKTVIERYYPVDAAKPEVTTTLTYDKKHRLTQKEAKARCLNANKGDLLYQCDRYTNTLYLYQANRLIRTETLWETVPTGQEVVTEYYTYQPAQKTIHRGCTTGLKTCQQQEVHLLLPNGNISRIEYWENGNLQLVRNLAYNPNGLLHYEELTTGEGQLLVRFVSNYLPAH